MVAVGHAGCSQPANAGIQTAIPGLSALGDAPSASQGKQLKPLQHLAWQVQPEPIWCPKRGWMLVAVQWHVSWCQLAGAL